MDNRLLIRGARQLLTLRGPAQARRSSDMRELGIIEDGSVLIIDGKISSVGQTRRIENLSEARSARVIEASGSVVMPGFVDSHTQLLSPPARLLHYPEGRQSSRAHGPLSDKHLFSSAVEYIRNTAAGTLEYHMRRHARNCLKHGTTTIETKSGYALNVAGELKMLKIFAAAARETPNIVATCLGAHSLPPEFENKPDQFLELVETELLPKIKTKKLAQFVDIICDPAVFSPDHVSRYLEASRRQGLGIKLHACQHGCSEVVRLAVNMGAVSIDGLTAVAPGDIQLLAQSSTVATLMPTDAQQRAVKTYPPARKLIDGGVAVAIATGFHPSVASTFNMQTVLAVACAQLEMTPEEAIVASTINGAHAVGRGAERGSIEYGKDADLLILGITDYRDLAYYFGSNSVTHVIRGGDLIFGDHTSKCTAA